MKQEFSYGAVVYCLDENGVIHYLIEKMALGHVSIPKGHIEKGETPLQCTLREIKEETNLDVDVDTRFKKTISYSPKPGVLKDVTFFVAKAKTFDIVSQPEEVKEAVWLTYQEAYGLLSYQSDKDTLEAANTYLSEKHK